MQEVYFVLIWEQKTSLYSPEILFKQQPDRGARWEDMRDIWEISHLCAYIKSQIKSQPTGLKLYRLNLGWFFQISCFKWQKNPILIRDLKLEFELRYSPSFLGAEPSLVISYFLYLPEFKDNLYARPPRPQFLWLLLCTGLLDDLLYFIDIIKMWQTNLKPEHQPVQVTGLTRSKKIFNWKSYNLGLQAAV